MISTSACSQDSKVEDKAQIKSLYEQMYKAMVEKDTATLSALHHDSFVLTHMTGMRQGKKEYINAIATGTLNYYEATHEDIDISVDGDRATLVGRSKVTAAVFGGGRHTWPLKLHFTLLKENGRWFLTSSTASTY